jgi:hypothetical protein
MSETPKTPTRDEPEALRRDIADKRRALGDTAAELAAKADVKSQAQAAVAAQASRPDPRAIAAAAVLLVTILLLIRRRRSR